MPHEYSWRVTLQDVDQFEILFYSRVFEALQRGIESLFEAGGRTYHEIANDTDYNYPIVATGAEYSRQVRWGSTVSLEITPTVGDTSFSFDAAGRIDGDSVFEVERTQAVIDTQTNEIVRVPPAIREPLEHAAE
jgi:acyl-CoA thioesterase FadM